MWIAFRHHQIAKMWSMDLKVFCTYSYSVERWRKSFILQKNRQTIAWQGMVALPKRGDDG